MFLPGDRRSDLGPYLIVTMLVDYAKQKAGPEQVEQVLSKVPALKSMMQ